ncbi:Ulp1 protease family, C-terminal catalytic domain-containing protein [Cryptosporidium muris RN66]|uniref:Ulp1 protease family, C-terminal catalytic domain-containing protein n=1 Tax=Cryptosporidium muris (strain RN66) TaxID=441375 RepID=B6A9E2_CRYMR|nr:Ulp1 protease family, C-terminal catalytic domain-containing protein [Cryptosporidium muris RN66]EEA04833.1 Ulp1 protease family, C-terminal catalytic domain-containing protein [Cryptosporidium muris RN66]|eukprot:XP_002139182.1 Ulp1 protease family, C-terminal catalytic domain-containing protein [Cryptosporidium muris RN66]
MRRRRWEEDSLPSRIMANSDLLIQHILLSTTGKNKSVASFNLDNLPYIKGKQALYSCIDTKNILIDTQLIHYDTSSPSINLSESTKNGWLPKNRFVYNKNENDSLKRSLEYFKYVRKRNDHLEILDRQLYNLAVCEKHLDNERNDFKQFVYGDLEISEKDDYQQENILIESNNMKSPMGLEPGEYNKALTYLSGEYPSSKIVAEHKRTNLTLTIALIQCLRPAQWLNDEVINFYMALLQDRSNLFEKTFSSNNTNKPKVWIWNTFFFSKLMNDGNSNGYCYKNVSRWTQRREIDLFDYDIIILPINVNKVHWTLGLVNLKDHYIQYFDSLGGSDQANSCYKKISINFCENISKYIIDEYSDKKKEVYPHKLIFLPYEGRVPQQNNGSDCGVFTCMFAECLSDNRCFDFVSYNTDELRLKMLIQCINGYISAQ